MGIQWHVLTDGDDAGKKYAATVRTLAENGRDYERDRLTTLPAPDMEHFLYRAGFDEVYHRTSMIPRQAKIQPHRVIEKAIHRTSKPDLAIEVTNQAKERGAESIPPLLKKMFSRVVWLARGRAD
jgi:putative ATP-dependent endonuclease of OLD family